MRIENGPEGRIPLFFKGYSERVRQAETGDKAMTVLELCVWCADSGCLSE